MKRQFDSDALMLFSIAVITICILVLAMILTIEVK